MHQYTVPSTSMKESWRHGRQHDNLEEYLEHNLLPSTREKDGESIKILNNILKMVTQSSAANALSL